MHHSSSSKDDGEMMAAIPHPGHTVIPAWRHISRPFSLAKSM